MLTPTEQARLQPRVRRMLFFFWVFPLVCLGFAAVVWLNTGNPGNTGNTVNTVNRIDFDQISLMSLLGILTGLLMFAMAFLVPLLILPTSTHLAAQLIQQHQTSEVGESEILDALIENDFLKYWLSGILITGGVFLNLVTFFMEQSGSAAVMVALGILLLLATIPWPGLQFRRLAKKVPQIEKELKLIRLQ